MVFSIVMVVTPRLSSILSTTSSTSLDDDSDDDGIDIVDTPGEQPAAEPDHRRGGKKLRIWYPGTIHTNT